MTHAQRYRQQGREQLTAAVAAVSLALHQHDGAAAVGMARRVCSTSLEVCS